MREITLDDSDAEIDPWHGQGGGGPGEPEMDHLSAFIKEFNDLFGGIEWEDADRVHRLITETIPSRVSADAAFNNARQNFDRENARIEHDRALTAAMMAIMRDDTELFRQFMDNQDFNRWLGGVVFDLTYEKRAAA